MRAVKQPIKPPCIHDSTLAVVPAICNVTLKLCQDARDMHSRIKKLEDRLKVSQSRLNWAIGFMDALAYRIKISERNSHGKANPKRKAKALHS